MAKKALVVGGGGLRGAYDAGVVATLGRELGPNYFDSVYASSVGVFAATFYLANQPDTIENTWRELVHGKQLVNFMNPFRGRHILDLEYLAEIFQDERSLLDLSAVIDSNSELTYTLTEYPSGRIRYFNPNRNNLFDSMRASSALPFVHSPVIVDGQPFVDGGLTNSLPVVKAIEDGAEEVIVVYNKRKGFAYGSKESAVVKRFLSLALPREISLLVRNHFGQNGKLDRMLGDGELIRCIRPKEDLPLSSVLDTDKERINASIDRGINDAQEFLRSYRP